MCVWQAEQAEKEKARALEELNAKKYVSSQLYVHWRISTPFIA